MRTGALALVLLAVTAVPAAAQTTPTTTVGAVASGYDTAGRRDPFVTLVAPRRPIMAPNRSVAPPMRPATGLAALSLADVNVRGVLRAGDMVMAILEGPNKKAFNVKADDKLADATVKSIDEGGVVFVVRPDGTNPVEVRKALRSAAEVIR
jgi:Tfp pilus assembly protein PilP